MVWATRRQPLTAAVWPGRALRSRRRSKVDTAFRPDYKPALPGLGVREMPR
jgi:hypothetical protein